MSELTAANWKEHVGKVVAVRLYNSEMFFRLANVVDDLALLVHLDGSPGGTMKLGRVRLAEDGESTAPRCLSCGQALP